MKIVQGFLVCLFVIWAFLIVAPQESQIRARNMCLPVEVVIRLFGASTRVIDESTGDSISRDTSTSVGSSCRTSFAPAVLGSLGLWSSTASTQTSPAPAPNASAAAPASMKPKVAPGMSESDAL